VKLPYGLYGISDAAWGDPVDLARQLATAGCRVIQLRAKDWTSGQVLHAARELVVPFRDQGVSLVINDHLSVAVELGVGVHLGQDDGDPAHARRLVPSTQLVGLSTHDLAQVECATDVDYIGFGPVFSTQSKVNALSPRGVEALRQAVLLSPVPVVAIGGITPNNLASVVATGVHSWTAIGAVLGGQDIFRAVKSLNRLS